MFTYKNKIEWMALLLLGLLIGSAICMPMYYKKTDEETYEPGEIFLKQSISSIMTSPEYTDIFISQMPTTVYMKVLCVFVNAILDRKPK